MSRLRPPVIALLLAAVLLLIVSTPQARAQGSRLVVSPEGPYTAIEAALAAAQDGDVIEVQGGTYTGPLVVDKAVTLEGIDWPLIDGGDTGTVVTLAAPNSAIIGFDIRGSGVEPDRDHAGITLMAAHTRAENNRLSDVLFGIFVARADHAVVRGNEITGKQEYDVGRKGDGIRLWYSQHVLVEDNLVYGVRDVVVWYSSYVTLRENIIREGRYGVHLMYCDEAIIEHNRLFDNSVGIYVMYTNATTLTGNFIRGQRGPSGYALAFKDADNIEAAGNVLVDNRVGIFLDGTPFRPDAGGYAHFTDNIIAFNDVGVVLQPAVRGSEMADNTFWENVEQVSLQGGGGQADWNTWQGNYWSDYTGFDADGDGLGDVPYHAERLFESLYDREARLRALIYSPAAQAIELAAEAFPVVRPQPKLSDPAPRTDPAPIPAGILPPRRTAGMIGAALGVLAVGLGGGLLALLPARTDQPRHVRAVSTIDGENHMEGPMAPPAIVVANVAKRYGSVQALDGVSFEARSGEAVALWGPNGAGKTTLLKAILGLIVFEGQITVAGRDARRQGKEARSLIGYVPQESVFYDWSVRDTMAFYARLKKADPVRIAVLLADLGLSEHVEKPVPALSGGLKQRLALAVALLSDPPVLLLDEPTANLDARARHDYLDLLASLRAAGKLIVFASHRFEELDALADRVIVLERGKVADVLPPSALRDRLELALLLWVPDPLQTQALALLKRQGFAAHFNGRGTIVVRISHQDKVRPLEALSAEGIKVLDFDLEQVTWN